MVAQRGPGPEVRGEVRPRHVLTRREGGRGGREHKGEKGNIHRNVHVQSLVLEDVSVCDGRGPGTAIIINSNGFSIRENCASLAKWYSKLPGSVS
jgi:hypothetical protein